MREWNAGVGFQRIWSIVLEYVDFPGKRNIARNIREDDVSPISYGCLHKGGQVVRWGGLKGVWSELDSNNSNYWSGNTCLFFIFC